MRIRTGNSPEVLTLLWKETISLGMGTSVGMLEQHYSKLTPMLMAKEFAGGWSWTFYGLICEPMQKQL